MARSSVSRFTQSLRGWCMARPIGAALMALCLGGAVAGGAMALSPTVDTALVFRGGVNIVVDAGAGADVRAYTVPVGRKFLLTDLVITNISPTTPALSQLVYTGSDSTCPGWTLAALRTNALHVPAAGTLHLPFVTGIGFTAGQHVCIDNPSGNATGWTIRGFLFE